MTMPSSGNLNMGGTSSPVSVNYELGRASPYNQTVSMNDSNVRSLAGVSSTSGTQWSMSSLYGKSAGFSSVSLASLPSEWYAYYDGDFLIQLNLIFYPNGQWFYTEASGAGTLSGSWGTPNSAGAGSAYWVRFTRSSFTPVGGGSYSTPTTGWLNLGSNQSVQVFAYDSNPTASSATYTIQIATDSAGANVIATRSAVTLVAAVTSPP